MKGNDSNYIRGVDAITRYICTNNVTDAAVLEDITNEARDTINTIQTINGIAKIIISSILPVNNDKLVNNITEKTNNSLPELCISEGYMFMNNNMEFFEMRNLIKHSYDNIQLIKRKEPLGNTMRKVLNNVSGTATVPARG